MIRTFLASSRRAAVSNGPPEPRSATTCAAALRVLDLRLDEPARTSPEQATPLGGTAGECYPANAMADLNG